MCTAQTWSRFDFPVVQMTGPTYLYICLCSPERPRSSHGISDLSDVWKIGSRMTSSSLEVDVATWARTPAETRQAPTSGAQGFLTESQTNVVFLTVIGGQQRFEEVLATIAPLTAVVETFQTDDQVQSIQTPHCARYRHKAVLI